VPILLQQDRGGGGIQLTRSHGVIATTRRNPSPTGIQIVTKVIIDQEMTVIEAIGEDIMKGRGMHMINVICGGGLGHGLVLDHRVDMVQGTDSILKNELAKTLGKNEDELDSCTSVVQSYTILGTSARSWSRRSPRTTLSTKHCILAMYRDSCNVCLCRSRQETA